MGGTFVSLELITLSDAPKQLSAASCKENRRRLDLDEELLLGEVWHSDPGCARRVIAERRFESDANGLTLVHVALLDVESQRTDLIEFRTNRRQRNAKIFETFAELTTYVASTNNVLICVPSNLAGHIHDIAERCGDSSNLRETVTRAIEDSDRNMRRSAHEGSLSQSASQRRRRQ